MAMNKLRVFTAFSGYDSQCLALNRLPIDYELVGWSEIDKYAIKGHNALFPDEADRNYGDMSSGISKTRLYQLAGNSIVVNVLEAIFRKLFIDTDPDDGQLKLF